MAKNETAINYEDDVDIAATGEMLAPLVKVVAHMRNTQQTVAKLEDELSKAQKELLRIEEVDIPTMMDELGLTAVELADGKELSIKETMYSSISAKNKPAAVSWLIAQGQGALVREDIIVPFDKGAVNEATQLAKLLVAEGYKFTVSENVNTGQVKSVIKELLGQGVEVPLALFGTHFRRKAVLK